MPIDLKSLDKFTLGALGAGALAFIVSFFSAYVKVSGKSFMGSVSVGHNAWLSFGTLGVLLLIAATAVMALKAFMSEVLPAAVPWQLAAAAAAGLGTLLLILRAFTYGTSGLGSMVSVGPGWSGYLLFLCGIALTACCALAATTSGEKLPQLNKEAGTAES